MVSSGPEIHAGPMLAAGQARPGSLIALGKGQEMTDGAVDSAAWIRRFHPVAAPEIRLACFPHIGGSASFYWPISAVMTAGVEVLAVQYPGRQDRSGEEPLTDIHRLADGAFGALRPVLSDPVALFGHSMGALIAFEVALRMEQVLGITPAAFIASSIWAPSRQRDGEIDTSDPTNMSEVLADLRRLKGTDPGLLDDPELMRGMLGTLRSDYIATDSYRCGRGVKVACPITVFVGDRDPHVSVEAAQAWSEHTTGGFALNVFGGDHFYLTSLRTAFVRELSEVLRASV
jgi:pyochelin biosynthesis protein PchC